MTRLTPAALAALALLLLASAPPASAYTCSEPAPGLRTCDIDDNGVPDVVFVYVRDQATFTFVAYKDASVLSLGAGWVTYGALGYHSGGVSVGCYDPNGDLDCDYASVAFGSTDAGYVDLQKFGERVVLCRYYLAGSACTPLL